MTRLLMWGDLAATGFGTVTRDLGRALLDQGVDVRFISMNEDGHELEEPFASRTLVLGGRNGWLGPTPEFSRAVDAERWAELQRKRMAGLFEKLPDGWQPEVALITSDPAGVIRSGFVDLVPEGFPAFHYVPIEGVGLPPSWTAIWQRIQPIAMSEFGAEQIERLTGRRPPVVYHGVDTTAFHPASARRPIMLPQRRDWLRSKDECKRHIGIDPKAIVLYRADRFMPRKRFGSMLRAVATVMTADPRVVLLLHCRTIDEGGNLTDFISHFPPAIGARIRSTGIHDAGGVADRKLLNILYNAADIYLSTGAEGFGLTIAESLAAGTPAIGLDFSAVPEVIGDAGVTVPVGAYVENEYAYFWATPDERAYVEALSGLIRDAARRSYLAARGPLHVRKFSWSLAAERMAGLFTPQEAVAA